MDFSKSLLGVLAAWIGVLLSLVFVSVGCTQGYVYQISLISPKGDSSRVGRSISASDRKLQAVRVAVADIARKYSLKELQPYPYRKGRSERESLAFYTLEGIVHGKERRYWALEIEIVLDRLKNEVEIYITELNRTDQSSLSKQISEELIQELRQSIGSESIKLNDM